MPTESKLKQTRSALSRKQILEAVTKIIADSGPGFVTFRSVAKEAGLSLGAITYHFDSKQAMIVAAYAYHHEQVGLRGRTLFAAQPTTAKRPAPNSAKAATKALLGFLKEEITTHRSEFVAGLELQLELIRDAELRDKIESVRRHHEQTNAELLKKVGSRQPLADAQLISAALQSIATTWLSRPNDPAYDAEVKRLVARLVEVFFGGKET